MPPSQKWSVPILTIGSAGGNAPLAITCSGADDFLLVIEVEEVAGQDVDRPDREMDFPRVDQIEVDQFKQRLAQRRGVVIAGGRFGAGRAQPGVDIVGLEKAGLAQCRRHERTREVAGLAVDVAVRRIVPDLAGRDPFPEDLQLFEPLSRRVAGYDRRVDSADRHAANPVRLHAGFVQGLIDAGLIGTECPATLQDQRDTVASVGPPTGSDGSI